jgi:translation initiation factor 2B subunit (eIF-2B alpha/beta/delta family)
MVFSLFHSSQGEAAMIRQQALNDREGITQAARTEAQEIRREARVQAQDILLRANLDVQMTAYQLGNRVRILKGEIVDANKVLTDKASEKAEIEERIQALVEKALASRTYHSQKFMDTSSTSFFTSRF